MRSTAQNFLAVIWRYDIRLYISSPPYHPILNVFSADKSMSILLGRPICLRDEDCTVNFPKELDDE